MIPLIQKYIITRTLRGILIAFLIVTGVIVLVDFVESTRNIGQDFGLNNFQVMQLTLLKVPSLIEQTIPFVVLFGVMATFFGLNKRSELIVLRASGLSVWNFLSPALSVTFLLGVIWATCFNPISSKSYSLYQSKLTQYDVKNAQTQSDIWLREVSEGSQTLIKARDCDSQTRKLSGVFISQSDILPDGNIRFNTRFDAESADIISTGYLQLYNVIENSDNIAADIIKHDTLSIPTNIRLEDIQSQAGANFNPPFWSIKDEINHTKRAGFSTTKLEMQWHKLLALPLSLIAMTFIAAAVSMTLVREGGTLRLLIVGTTIGFIVFFTNSVFNAFGESTTVSVLMAAWTIPIMTFFLGVYYLSTIEDG